MAGKFVLKNATGGKFMFNLKASNGEIILTSETYQEKSGALSGIESVKKNSVSDSNYERKIAVNNQFYFVLKAANNQVIGKSEMYTTRAAMENGIESVKKNAPGATTEDQTE
jgi:uncharacterized protein YegP (UPF0339 family)